MIERDSKTYKRIFKIANQLSFLTGDDLRGEISKLDKTTLKIALKITERRVKELQGLVKYLKARLIVGR